MDWGKSVWNSQLQCLNNLIYHDFVKSFELFFFLINIWQNVFIWTRVSKRARSWLSKVERQTKVSQSMEHKVMMEILSVTVLDDRFMNLMKITQDTVGVYSDEKLQLIK